MLSETSATVRDDQRCEAIKPLIEAEDCHDTKTHSKINSCDKVGGSDGQQYDENGRIRRTPTCTDVSLFRLPS